MVLMILSQHSSAIMSTNTNHIVFPSPKRRKSSQKEAVLKQRPRTAYNPENPVDHTSSRSHTSSGSICGWGLSVCASARPALFKKVPLTWIEPASFFRTRIGGYLDRGTARLLLGRWKCFQFSLIQQQSCAKPVLHRRNNMICHSGRTEHQWRETSAVYGRDHAIRHSLHCAS